MRTGPVIGMMFLSFGRDVFAGIEYSLFNLAKGLQENGVSVFVYSGHLSGRSTSVYGVPVFRSSLLPKRLPRGDDTVRAAIRRSRNHICQEIEEFIVAKGLTHLYVCDPLWGIVQPSGVWRNIQIPMLLSLHVLNSDDQLIESAGVPYTHITVVSESLANDVRNRVELPHLHTVPNSIDLDVYHPGSRTRDRASRPTIFCNGRIAPEKGIDTLLLAFAELLEEEPDSQLVLCGGAYPFGNGKAYLASIRTQIVRLGIERSILILPRQGWFDTPKQIRAATLVVLPSLRETFGRAALEAMACGVPLVVTSVGNLPDLVGNAAIVVPPSSPRELAAAMLKVIQSPTLQHRLGKAGPKRASRYGNRQVARQVLRLLGIKPITSSTVV